MSYVYMHVFHFQWHTFYTSRETRRKNTIFTKHSMRISITVGVQHLKDRPFPWNKVAISKTSTCVITVESLAIAEVGSSTATTVYLCSTSRGSDRGQCLPLKPPPCGPRRMRQEQPIARTVLTQRPTLLQLQRAWCHYTCCLGKT